MINRRKILIGGSTAIALAGGATYWSIRGMGAMSDYDAYSARLRAPLPDPATALDLLRYATLAANGHNTQPWRFQIAERSIAIRPDLARRTPVVDPDDHHLYVSLGCAAENLAIAAAARGKPGELRFETGTDNAVIFDCADGASVVTPLFDAIPRRQSTRAEYDGHGVSAADLHLLSTASVVAGVDTVLITDKAMMGKVRDLVIAGNTAQMADPAFVRELEEWLRFNPRDAMVKGDGLFGAASGNPTLPTWLGPTMFRLVFQAKSENDKYARHIDSSAGIAIFCAAQANTEHWVLAGLPGRRPDVVMRFGYGPAMPFSPRRAPPVTS